MCCFFNKAYLRIPFDIIKKPKVILLYHCWNHVLFSFIVVKDAASHSTNYSLPPPPPPPENKALLRDYQPPSSPNKALLRPHVLGMGMAGGTLKLP